MKIKQLIIFVFVFIALLFLSEFIYFSRNKPFYLIPYYLNRARASVSNSDGQRALEYLSKVAEIKLKEVSQEYPELVSQTSITTPTLPNNPELEKAYINLFRKENFKTQPDPSKWAKFFYSLGLLAYKNNEFDLVAPFWLTAINFTPEWSYLHIELANFYLTKEETNKAGAQIEFCLQFDLPQNHCRQFMEENIQTNSPETVGFLEKDINDI